MSAVPEIWRPIPGLSGYEVSSRGQVRSRWQKVTGGFRGQTDTNGAWKVLKQASSESGHLRVFIGLRDVRAIRGEHQTSTQKALAEKYGVSRRTIQNVLQGNKWGWVA